MNSNRSRGRTGAFTLVELLCVIAIIGILTAFILSAVSQAKRRVLQTGCADHLRQTTLAFQLFMHDHDGRFPMKVPMADGGSQEFVQNGYAVGGQFYFAYRHFQALSNELGTPKILICPTDLRVAATNFGGLQNSNLSYFVGVRADFDQPNSLLAGDRNLATNRFSDPSILAIVPDSRLSWREDLHQFKGDLAFADGRVEEWTDARMTRNGGELAGSDLFMPTVVSFSGTPTVPGSGGGSYFPPQPVGETPQPSPAPASGDTSGTGQSPMSPTTVSPAHHWADPPAPPQRTIADLPLVTNQPPGAMNKPDAGAPMGGGTVTRELPKPETQTFDENVVRVLRRAIVGFYLLIGLALLLWLLFARWRKSWRQKIGEDPW